MSILMSAIKELLSVLSLKVLIRILYFCVHLLSGFQSDIFLLCKPLWVNVFVYIVHLFQGSFKVIDWDNEVQIDF